MKRQVIQIMAVTNPNRPETLYALCDDGTMWYVTRVVETEWKQLPDVPQPPPPSAEELNAEREAAQRRRERNVERLEELRRKWEGEERSNVEPS